MEKFEKHEITLDSFAVVADALTSARKTLRASRCERFNKALSEALCTHIQVATKEALYHKSRFPGTREYVYKARFSKTFVEMLADQSITLLSLYGIDFTEPEKIQITLRF